MFFDQLRFPEDIAYGATGGPEFSTDIATSSSGYEQRNINWQAPKYRYNLAPAIKSKAQLETIISFFRLCHGMAIAFRFKDWSDYQFNKEQIGIGDGVKKEFQLIKTYQYMDLRQIRKIFKPVGESIKLYCNDVEAHVEIISETGLVRLKQAPKLGEAVIADGEFDVPVRFDADHLITSLESYELYSHLEIPLVEVRL